MVDGGVFGEEEEHICTSESPVWIVDCEYERLSGMPRVKEGWYVYGEIVEQLTTVNIVLYTL